MSADTWKAWPIGTRVVFTEEVGPIYPETFVIHEGTTGQVTESNECCVFVRVDQHVPGLSDDPEWQGEFQWPEQCWDNEACPFAKENP